VGLRGAVVQALQPLQRGEAPLLVTRGRDGEVGDVVRRDGVQLRLRLSRLALPAVRVRRGLDTGGQPTAPSICSSIRRLSSSAYSIGSSRAIGSTKPRTIMAIASSSLRPRL